MKTKIIIILLFFNSLNILSQSTVVVDSISKEPLPFSIVKYGKYGFYTDDNGYFDRQNIKSDTIEISYLGYYSKKILKNSVSDTIFLKERNNVIDEVILRKSRVKRIKPLKPSRIFPNILLQPYRELIMVIKPNNKVVDAHIESISLLFDKMKEKHIKKTNFKTYIRINIYQMTNNILESTNNHAIYSSAPIAVDLYNKDKIVLDISSESIYFKKEGLIFGIEMIGNLNTDKKFVLNGQYIRPKITPKKSQYYTAVTYIKYNLSDNVKIEPINDILNKGFAGFGKKSIERNLSIGFVLE